MISYVLKMELEWVDLQTEDIGQMTTTVYHGPSPCNPYSGGIPPHAVIANCCPPHAFGLQLPLSLTIVRVGYVR